MLMTPLASPTFLKNLTHARPWKDIVGPNHGEYTHRLQWCVLIRGHYVDKSAGIFKHIGGLAPVPVTPKLSFTVWDALFDRVKRGNPDFPNTWPFWAEDRLDFRSPEALLDWLCLSQQQKAYPLLAGFLKARKEKRLFQQQDGSASNFAADYLARKVWGQEYNTLSKPDQLQIQEYLDEAAGRDRRGPLFGDAHPVILAQSAEKGIGLVQPTATGYQFPHIKK
jgi:hypothetical protein